MKLELLNKDGESIIIVTSDYGVCEYLTKQFMKTVDHIFNNDLFDVCISKNEITKKLYTLYNNLSLSQPYIDYKAKYLNVSRHMNEFYLSYCDGVQELSCKLNIKGVADSRLNKFSVQNVDK